MHVSLPADLRESVFVVVSVVNCDVSEHLPRADVRLMRVRDADVEEVT